MFFHGFWQAGRRNYAALRHLAVTDAFRRMRLKHEIVRNLETVNFLLRWPAECRVCPNDGQEAHPGR